jgi:hypothetical protein
MSCSFAGGIRNLGGKFLLQFCCVIQLDAAGQRNDVKQKYGAKEMEDDMGLKFNIYFSSRRLKKTFKSREKKAICVIRYIWNKSFNFIHLFVLHFAF